MIGARTGFGVNTYAYTQSMRASDCLRHLKSLGFAEVELMVMPQHMWVTDGAAMRRETRRTARSEGMDIVSLNTANLDINIAAAAPEMRGYSIDLIRQFIGLAGDLGVEAFILGPGKPNPLFPLPFPTMRDFFFRALDTLLPTAQDAGIAFWVENMPFTFLPDAERLMATLDAYGANEVRVCYDVANAHFIGEDPKEGLERVTKRLELVHLSDTPQSSYRHDPIGRGDIDFARLAGPAAAACPHRKPILEVISETPDADLTASHDALLDMGYSQ